MYKNYCGCFPIVALESWSSAGKLSLVDRPEKEIDEGERNRLEFIIIREMKKKMNSLNLMELFSALLRNKPSNSHS